MAPTLNRSLADLGALLHLVDPTLPIGGFNHSNGLETFVVRLLKIFIRYEQHPMLSQFQQAIQNKTVQGYFPIVFAIVAQAMGLSKADTLYAFYYNAAVGTITNGVKLIPLSQMDGQDILFDLRSALLQAVELSLEPNLDWLGAATLANDIRSMQHEVLYTRLYMS